MGPDHRVDDLAIAGAATQHAAKGILHLRRARLRHLAQQRHGRDHHPRCANSALRGLMVLEALHQCLRVVVGFHQPRQRLHLPPHRLLHGHQAGADRRAIDQHSAGPAIARVAADLYILAVQPLAQRVRQAFTGQRFNLRNAAVQGERGHFCRGRFIHHRAPFKARITARRIKVTLAARR